MPQTLVADSGQQSRLSIFIIKFPSRAHPSTLRPWTGLGTYILGEPPGSTKVQAGVRTPAVEIQAEGPLKLKTRKWSLDGNLIHFLKVF
jgi:hypothetical protein